MKKWEQLSFDARFTGCQLDAKITIPPEEDYILVTLRRYGLPKHHIIGEQFERFNRTPPGLLRAVSAVADALTELREIHGIHTDVIEVAEVVDMEDIDPAAPF